MTDNLENTLVEKLCERNGWEISDNEDYDHAVRDIKWFLATARPLIDEEILQFIKDYGVNSGHILEEYCNGKDHTNVKSEWILLVQALDNATDFGRRTSKKKDGE